jgi:vacuolar-type H+-ATPase subunit H
MLGRRSAAARLQSLACAALSQAEKDAEKERAKAEKEAEREKAKVGIEGPRATPPWLQRCAAAAMIGPAARSKRLFAALQADKEAEKEAKKAKKTGFKNVDELKKSSNKFLAFFQPKAAAAAAVTPGPSSLAAAAAAGTPARSQQAGGSQQPTQEPGAEGATTGKRERGYFELFLKPPEGPHIRRCCPRVQQAQATALYAVCPPA